MLFIPVLNKIGFLNFKIYSIKGKLLHSPDPILNASTPNLLRLNAASLEKGVLRKIIPFFST